MRQEDDPEAFATNMPVLVTGATGFIGAHVVKELLSRGVPVRAMVRDLSLAEMFEHDSNLEIVKADLFDVESLRSAVDGCEEVIHCAASLYVGANDVKKEVIDPSITGVRNLCKVMDNVTKIVHTSSVAAIRSTNFENGKVFDCNDWCNDASENSNAYGYAKAEAEKIMRDWADGRGCEINHNSPVNCFWSDIT